MRSARSCDSPTAQCDNDKCQAGTYTEWAHLPLYRLARTSHPALHHTNHHQYGANNSAAKITRIFRCSSVSVVFGYGEWIPRLDK